MRVRDHDQALAAGAHAREKILGAGQEADVHAVLVLQASSCPCRGRASSDRGNTTRACRPSPSKRGASVSCAAAHGHAVHARVSLRHDLAPEEIVESEIEQRAVHVDEHGVDAVPIDDGFGCRCHVSMIQERPMTDSSHNGGLLAATCAIARDAGRAILGSLRPRRLRRCAQERRLAAHGSGSSGPSHHHARARGARRRLSRSCRKSRCRPSTSTRRSWSRYWLVDPARRHQGVREAQRRIHGQHRARR